MFIILLPASPDRVEEKGMNFPFEPHSKAKLAIDLHLFVYYGRLLHAKIGGCCDGRPYLSTDWFCACCGQTHQAKVDGRGDAVTHLGSWCTRAAERGSTRAHLLASCLWLNISHEILCSCHHLKRESRYEEEGYSIHPFDAIDTGRVEWWAAPPAAKNTGIVWGNKRKESSYCDQVRENQPFLLLAPLRVLDMLCGLQTVHWFSKINKAVLLFLLFKSTTAQVCSCESNKYFSEVFCC